MGGVIYFQEIRQYSTKQAFMFTLGILITIFGVALLSRRKNTNQNLSKAKESVKSDTASKLSTDMHTTCSSHLNEKVFDNFLDMSPRLSLSCIIDDLNHDAQSHKRDATRSSR